MRDRSVMASSSPKGEEIMNLLEINLISAQGLKQPSSNLGKRLQTYAVTYIDPSFKLRTRIDKIGSENPTWNDKFFFKVPSNFVSLESSAISVEIYSVGVIKDQLIGTVRFLINNDRRLGLSNGKGKKASGIPCFTALQIRRPLSGRFFGVLNVGFMMVNDEDLIRSPALVGVSGIGFRDLMGGNRIGNGKEQKKPPRIRKSSNKENENQENSGGGGGGGGGGGDSSDADSTCSSSSNSFGSSSILKDLNWRKDLLMMGKNRRLSEGGARLCGLMGFQRKIHLSPSDQNLYASSTSFDDDHSN